MPHSDTTLTTSIAVDVRWIEYEYSDRWTHRGFDNILFDAAEKTNINTQVCCGTLHCNLTRPDDAIRTGKAIALLINYVLNTCMDSSFASQI